MAINLANNNSLANITALPSSISGGAMNLISTQTASGSSTISFTSGIDDTYDSYVFKFYNIHPATDGSQLKCNFSVDGGSNYNVAKTTSSFFAEHLENGNSDFGYNAGKDEAQATGDMFIFNNIGSDNDQSGSGSMTLFNPSSTVFVKHFIMIVNEYQSGDASVNNLKAGYGNTTSAIDAVIFRMNSGNIDSGVIKLYGVS